MKKKTVDFFHCWGAAAAGFDQKGSQVQDPIGTVFVYVDLFGQIERSNDQ